MRKIANENESHPIAGWISTKAFYILFGLLILLSITTIVLAAVTLGIVINRLNAEVRNVSDGVLSLVEQIKIDDLMKHLKQLQAIADQSNGTRAIGTRGFNGTLDYITDQLTQNTDLVIRHEYFTVPKCVVQGKPRLQSQIDGLVNDHAYLADFTHLLFSPGTAFDSFIRLVSIPNLGCRDSDWGNASAKDAVALVRRGDCTFPEKSLLAEKYHVKGLLIYNDGTAPDRFQPFRNVRSHFNATIPGYFLSYNLGMQFVNATSNASANSSIVMRINVSDAEGIGNICADTRTGDQTKTIIIGSHSDGVLDGSGINDDGKKTSIHRNGLVIAY